MAIIRPITKTVIATNGWGVPITDEVNRLSGLVDASTPTAWTGLAFGGGWVSWGAPWQVGQYCKIGTQVFIRGVIKAGALNGLAFTMPVGFRPAADLRIVVTPTANLLTIASSNGIAQIYGSDNSMVGINFSYFTT